VIDHQSAEGVGNVEVILMTHRGRELSRTIATPTGQFDFEVTRGWVRFRASRLGYAATTTPVLRIDDAQVYELEIRLDRDAIPLAPLEVVARRRSQSGMLDGFHHRRGVGLGHYFSREEIRQRNPFALTDVLATVPGVRITPSRRAGSSNVYMARALPGEGDCPVQVYLDGILVNRRNLQLLDREPESGKDQYGLRSDHDFNINDVVAISSIEAIEVYRGVATVPAEFLNTEARCGVVAIWTRTPRHHPSRND